MLGPAGELKLQRSLDLRKGRDQGKGKGEKTEGRGQLREGDRGKRGGMEGAEEKGGERERRERVGEEKSCRRGYFYDKNSIH